KQSLKSLSNQIGDLVVNFSYPDGRLVSDLEELALSLMEGGEGLDPSSQTNEPTMPNSETVPGPEQHDSRPGSEQGEERGVEGTPTPPKSRIVSKCVDCGKEPTAGENFTLKGVGELCREHFEKRTAARREVKERKEGGED
ncbi:MAG: hypothetical protein KGJ45_11155, partial [Elusimicrobia bacterium]|nr:hypothetical protein [Elusimicrobiota bacterium]